MTLGGLWRHENNNQSIIYQHVLVLHGMTLTFKILKYQHVSVKHDMTFTLKFWISSEYCTWRAKFCTFISTSIYFIECISYKNFIEPLENTGVCHHSDVIMSAVASRITSFSIVYSTVYFFRVIGLCAGNSPVTREFPAQRASNAENVSIWWRHHLIKTAVHRP